MLKKSEAYERIVAGLLKLLSPNAQVRHNQRVVGHSGIERQIDVLVEDNLGPFPVRAIVDCKAYAKRIDVKDVEMFHGMVEDLRANVGILFAQAGYTDGAKKRAEVLGQDRIRLCSAVDLRAGFKPKHLRIVLLARVVKPGATRVRIDTAYYRLLGNPQLDTPIINGDSRESTLAREAFLWWNASRIHDAGQYSLDLSGNWRIGTKQSNVTPEVLAVDIRAEVEERVRIVDLTSGRGIVDHHGKLVAFDELTTEWFRTDDIDLWPLASEADKKATLVTLFMRWRMRTENE